MSSKNYPLLILILLASALLFSGCSRIDAKKTVTSFLDAYLLQDYQAASSLLQTPEDLPNASFDEKIPDSLIQRYNHLFTDFTYQIERIEVDGDRANIYTKITYKDAGSPSLQAYHLFQDNLNAIDSVETESMNIPLLMENAFLNTLDSDMESIEEVIVIHVVKSEDDSWRILLSNEFKNALTANTHPLRALIDTHNY